MRWLWYFIFSSPRVIYNNELRRKWGKKLLLPKVRCYPGICPERPRITTKIFSQGVWSLGGGGFEPETSGIRKRVNLSTATLSPNLENWRTNRNVSEFSHVRRIYLQVLSKYFEDRDGRFWEILLHISSALLCLKHVWRSDIITWLLLWWWWCRSLHRHYKATTVCSHYEYMMGAKIAIMEMLKKIPQDTPLLDMTVLDRRCIFLNTLTLALYTSKLNMFSLILRLN
jgi:hypothetical protein